MTSEDVRLVTAFGKRIAKCVLDMATVVTEVVESLPLEVSCRVLLRLSEINREMGEASEAWEKAAIPTEMDA